jgi:GTPase SAR1 family protein
MGVIDRVRAIRWLRPAVVICAMGLVALIAAQMVAAVSAHGDQLDVLARKAEIIGAAVAAVGAVASVAAFALSRLSANVAPVSSADLLRRRVADYEQKVLIALLSGLTPADLAYTAAGAGVRRAPDRVTHGGIFTLWGRYSGELVRYRKAGSVGPRDGDLKGIGAYYQELWAHGVTRLLILGQPGSGKTVLAIELILQLLQKDPESTASTKIGGKIPVRFSVADWTSGTDVRGWLAGRLNSDYGIPLEAAKALVAERMLLPVLDGLDEMDPEPVGNVSVHGRSTLRAAAFLAALNTYPELGRPAPVVVTCRQDTYEQLREAGSTLSAHQEITILDLDTTQIRGYLHARYPDMADPRRRGWDQVLDRLSKPDGEAARRVLATPWRLLLAITASDAGRVPVQLLAAGVGENPGSAAERIDLELLASYIPAATRLTVRRSRSGISSRTYDPGKVTSWMHHLTRHLQWQAQQLTVLDKPPLGMSGIDLVPHLLWPIGGSRLVRALHTALAVLLAAALCTSIALTLRPASALSHEAYEVLRGDFSGPGIDILFLVLYPAIIYLFVEPIRFAGAGSSSAPIRVPFSLRLRAGLLVGLAAGLVAGLVFGLVVWLTVGLAVGLAAGLAVGLAVGAVAGLTAFGLVGGWRAEGWRPDADLAGPYDALRWDRLYGLGVGLAVGLAAGLTAGLTIGLPKGLPRGLATGLALWLTVAIAAGHFTASTWVRYRIGAGCAAIRGRLPTRLKSFMMWACDSGLLRIAGTAYQFRHRQLQVWLTEDVGANSAIPDQLWPTQQAAEGGTQPDVK